MFVTGVIVGISSLVVTVVAPIIGYLVTVIYEMVTSHMVTLYLPA